MRMQAAATKYCSATWSLFLDKHVKLDSIVAFLFRKAPVRITTCDQGRFGHCTQLEGHSTHLKGNACQTETARARLTGFACLSSEKSSASPSQEPQLGKQISVTA